MPEEAMPHLPLPDEVVPHVPAPDEAVLNAFDLDHDSARPAASGLINRTWHVRSRDGEPLVLQRVNAIFPPEINTDIDVVTRHLAAKGMVTPRLVAGRSGALWVERESAVWRVLTHVEGVTRDAIETPRQASEAGRILASFHRAVADLDHAFANARLGVHDTAAHVRALEQALDEHTTHASYAAVRALAEEVLALAGALPPLARTPDRVVHGDPKVSNIVFEQGTDRARCLIDLDTLARMPVTLELGDAFRSWCNPGVEDAADAAFSLPLFEAAMGGYAQGAGETLSEAERTAIPDAVLTITVELAVRFCTDALRERYFAWDATRYPSASAHNQARTGGQLALARSIRTQRRSIEAAVEIAFERGSGSPV
jgi:Ser/Thr protein kinase RdoA (MazF antagonist)